MGALFVFIGLPGESSNANLAVLLERLDKKFLNNEIAIRFTRKEQLLLARLDNVSFYISFLKNNEELKEWYQLAIDAELILDEKPVTKDELIIRYQELKTASYNIYQKIHYSTGLIIMEEIEKFTNLIIFSFQ